MNEAYHRERADQNRDELNKRTKELRAAECRIYELEVAMRAALSFVQERFPNHTDGHADMMIAAMRGALRKVRD